LLPPGVVFNYNRLSRPGSGITADSLVAMAQSIDRAAHDVAQAYPEVILYGCTSGSFLFGIGREAETAQRIADLTGIPAITTSTAVVQALRAVGARRVAMFTPYPDEVNEHEVAFLEHYGFDAPCVDAFRCATSEAIRQISSEQTAELVLRHRQAIGHADAVFISCTNLLSVDQIPALEEALGKPVVSSNQASVWAVLQALRVDTSEVPGGILFTRRAEITLSTRPGPEQDTRAPEAEKVPS
jgi:maleate isomerase